MKQSEHVRIELLLDFRRGVLLEHAELTVAGVVHQHVDAAEASNSCFSRSERVQLLAHVELDRQQALGMFLERGRNLIAIAASRDDTIAGSKRRFDDFGTNA